MFSSKQLQAYLVAQEYHPTYFKGGSRGFYNPRNRQTINIPIEDMLLSKQDILELFQHSCATDRPPEIEWYNLKVFLYEISCTQEVQ